MTTAIQETLPGQWDEVEDGFHGVPMEEYLRWPLVSASGLLTLRERTPAYMKWEMENEDTDGDSASSSLGTLTHTALLEPDLLEGEYVVAPEPDPEVFTTASGEPSSNPKATKAWKDQMAELEATGKKVVTKSQWDAALAMRDAVHKHKRARQLLEAEGLVEKSAVVTDPVTGVRCKIRPDKLIPEIGAHVNVKTSKNAKRTEFMHDVFRYGYFVGMAFYERLLPALGFDHRKPLLLAIETHGPKLVNVHELDLGTMDAGAEIVGALLMTVAQCFDAGYWPGYPEEITSLSLPHYAWTRVDEELEEYGF